MAGLEHVLHGAVEQITPDLRALVGRLSASSEVTTEIGDEATEQFLRAFVALLHEGIDGGREQRDLVMSTAVPALVAAGQTAPQLVESHVAFFMALQARLLEAVPGERREEAALWLAEYAARYTCEVLEAASGA